MTSIEIILNSLILVALILSALGAKITPLVHLKIRSEYGFGALLAILALSWISRGLWIGLALETGYWQFAAIALIPWLISLGARLSRDGDI